MTTEPENWQDFIHGNDLLKVVQTYTIGFIAENARGHYAAFRGFDEMLGPWTPHIDEAARCIDPDMC